MEEGGSSRGGKGGGYVLGSSFAASSSSSSSSSIALQSIITLTFHGVSKDISPHPADFAHLASAVRKTLQDAISDSRSDVTLTTAKVDDWQLAARQNPTEAWQEEQLERTEPAVVPVEDIYVPNGDEGLVSRMSATNVLHNDETVVNLYNAPPENALLDTSDSSEVDATTGVHSIAPRYESATDPGPQDSRLEQFISHTFDDSEVFADSAPRASAATAATTTTTVVPVDDLDGTGRFSLSPGTLALGTRRKRRLSSTITGHDRSSAQHRLLRFNNSRARGGFLSNFLYYITDTPPVQAVRRLTVADFDPSHATADLTVTFTITGVQEGTTVVSKPLRPASFANLLVKAAVLSVDDITVAIRDANWLQITYFRYVKTISFVPRKDRGVILAIPGDHLDLLPDGVVDDGPTFPAGAGRSPSSPLSLAGRTRGGASDATNTLSTVDESMLSPYRGNIPNLGMEDPSSLTAHHKDGGMALGLIVFVALAGAAAFFLSAYLTRRAVNRKRDFVENSQDDRATKARRAYDAPSRICSRDWVAQMRRRIENRSYGGFIGQQSHPQHPKPKRRGGRRQEQTNSGRPRQLPSGAVMDNGVAYASSSTSDAASTTSSMPTTRNPTSLPTSRSARSIGPPSNRKGSKKVHFGPDSVAGESDATQGVLV